MSRGRGKRAQQPDPATENFERGCAMVGSSPLLSPLWAHVQINRKPGNRCPADGWAVVSNNGVIYAHPTRRGDPYEWAYVLAHCLLHLGFGHFDTRLLSREWNDACDWFLLGFQRQLKVGDAPPDMDTHAQAPAATEEKIYQILLHSGPPIHWHGCGAAGQASDMVIEPEPTHSWYRKPVWHEYFADGLAQAVSRAVLVAAGEDPATSAANPRTPAERARRWFMNSYPLLGALAATFKLIEDTTICYRLGIGVAAVDTQSREIFFNPGAGLSDEEYKFVMAHELLHVGLRHDVRRNSRDPFLWNIAADYVINAWLIEMRIGVMPKIGALHDPELKGESAESIYDRIVTDMRRFRRMATMRGIGVSDILERNGPEWWTVGEGLSLDDFYRSALGQGLSYHEAQGRGYLPAGLLEEIQALAQPPIPWDVELARWFDNYFPPLELVRSYARPSRHQAATPDIPRPRWVLPPDWNEGRTFGVLLDTSGSMDRTLLAKALGSIASYAASRDVPAVRVVFCDAATYDQGYMRAEDIAGEVKVRGRGGTILQPAVDLLERTEDFPKEGPVLIITDGYCDKLDIKPAREHAFLLPEGHSLPFVPRGRVFYVR